MTPLPPSNPRPNKYYRVNKEAHMAKKIAVKKKTVKKPAAKSKAKKK